MTVETLVEEAVSSRKFPVIELFGPTIQGEGAVAGEVSFFLRTGGCSLRCAWCDSMHAVDPKQIKKNATYMGAREIFEKLAALSSADDRRRGKHRPWVTLTGGDPVLWDLTELVSLLYFGGFRVAVETQGSLWGDWLEHCDLVTVSPKPPSSGMADKVNVPLLRKYAVRLRERLVAKVVAFDEADLEFAERVSRILPTTRLYLSAGTPQAWSTDGEGIGDVRSYICSRYAWLCEAVLGRPALHYAILGLQLHVLAWGRELGR